MKVSSQKVKISAEAESNLILVGTYRLQQFKWIASKGLYNYPVSHEEEKHVDFYKKITELWLFNGKSSQKTYSAEYVTIVSKQELCKKYGYPPPKGKDHGEKYLLFKVTGEISPSSPSISKIIIRTKDFSHRSPRIAAELCELLSQEHSRRTLPQLGKYLPEILTKIQPSNLFVCEEAIQLDFFEYLKIPTCSLAQTKLNSSSQTLKLATVFSGIGAIEQALLREHINHEIVFACDNGDLSPFPYKKDDIEEYKKDLHKLSAFIVTLCPNTEGLKFAAENLNSQLEVIKGLLNGAPAHSSRPDRELRDRIKMLYEGVHFYKFRATWGKEPDSTKRKRLVDQLYRPLIVRNKVRQSYMANYPITDDQFHWNVSFLEGAPYRDKIDLFVGGSPCQSFSLVGKQMGLSDTRGTLFYDYARLISEIKPKCFIFENVRALLSNDNGRTWKTISKIFTDLGYDWKYKVLNAKDYGMPQNRERIFVVGFRKDLGVKDSFQFPRPQKLTRTMQDFLLDSVPGKYYLPEKGVKFVLDKGNLSKRYTQIDGNIQLCQKKNQQFNWHGDFVFVDEKTAEQIGMPELEKYYLSEKVRKYVLATGTKTFYSRPKTDLPIARPLLTTMHKMHRAGVDNYITKDGRIRKLAPRECLRLMGFSDSFKIAVSDTSMYQQAGNTIVVDVLVSILKEIKKVLPEIFLSEGNVKNDNS